MHNETKVNTNNPSASPSDEKNIARNTKRYIGSIEVPYGETHIKRGCAEDHMSMRTAQLGALLQLMHGETLPSYFQTMSDHRQNSLLWLASELAEEIDNMVALLVSDVMERKL